MFQVYLTNIPDRGMVSEHATMADAITAGKRTGFEFVVIHAGLVKAAWSFFGGLRQSA